MNFDFTEEERSVVELARKILEDLVTNERLKTHEASGEAMLADAWRALAEANLLGVAIPEQHGGMDIGFTALCLLCEEIGRTVAPVPVYASLVLGALPLARFGSEAEKAAWLPRVASGEVILTGALTELESSDECAPTTTAEPFADGFRLNGEKSLVPFAGQASRLLVAARLGDETGLFWVAPDAPGVRIESQQSSDGTDYGFVTLEDVEVPTVHRLGDADALRWLVERATVARCAMQLGVTERALEMTAAYGRDRVQFDVQIGSFQAFHQRAADAFIHVEGLRLTTWEAVWKLATGLDARDMVAVAKFAAAEGGAFASYACQHLHGGVGIDVDYPLHRYFKWASQIEHELGAAKIHLERLGDRIRADEIAAF